MKKYTDVKIRKWWEWETYTKLCTVVFKLIHLAKDLNLNTCILVSILVSTFKFQNMQEQCYLPVMPEVLSPVRINM